MKLTREQARAQLASRENREETICAVQRDLWKELQKMPESPERAAAEELLITAYLMGKRMAAKLAHYREPLILNN